jgi:hypothetical protein
MKVVKWIVFGMWTLGVIALAFWLANSVLATGTYKGTEFRLVTNSNHHLLINAGSATLDGGSTDFFLLRKSEGESVMGLQSQPPLGIDSDTYYKSAPQQVSGGYWIVQDGTDVGLHFTSSVPITVENVMNEGPKIGLTICFALLGLLFWILIDMIIFGSSRKGSSDPDD